MLGTPPALILSQDQTLKLKVLSVYDLAIARGHFPNQRSLWLFCLLRLVFWRRRSRLRLSSDGQAVTRRAGLKSISALACARASTDCVHVLSSFQRTEARLLESAFPAFAHCRDRLVQGNLPNLLRPSHCRQDFFSSRPASARFSFSQTRRPITQISSPRTENRRRLAEQAFERHITPRPEAMCVTENPIVYMHLRGVNPFAHVHARFCEITCSLNRSPARRDVRAGLSAGRAPGHR